MKVLIYCPLDFNLNSRSTNKMGGIESLNIDLAKKFADLNIEVFFANKCLKIKKINNIINLPIDYLKKNHLTYKFDTIISSNDSTVFNLFPFSKKILWLHNPLQIEKSLRKRQLFSILKNDISVVFVSNYLNQITSKFYFFKKRKVIKNFLTSDFTKKIAPSKRKLIFVWSVQRDTGLNDTINMWIKNINSINKNAKFYILGLDKLPYKYKSKFLKSKNIFHLGRVSKFKLKKIYTQSTAMICLGFDETFCLNALEANSCGLPIITFGKTALKEFIKNNYNGFFANDYLSLSKIIINFLNFDNENMQRLSSNSIKHSLNFTIDKVFQDWVKLLK